MKKVLIADDHQVVIDGLSLLVKSTKGFEVSGIAKNGWEVIDFLEANTTPDVLLMDISMPELDGIETMKKLQVSHPQLVVIILSMHLSSAYARGLIELGVKGYLQKDCDKKELVAALNAVSKGETFLSKNVTELLVQEVGSRKESKEDSADTAPKITQRQLDVLKLIGAEHTSKGISKILGLSFNTVETHRRHLLNKFGVKSTVGLVREAMKYNLLD
jgi:DNA-binding NarL/FixJ family response regulator